MPKVLAVSDLHGVLPRRADGSADVDPCDVLIIAGDICPDFLHSSYDKGEARQANWLANDFRDWLEDVQTAAGKPKVIGIAGNHDFVFERGIHPKLPWQYIKDHSTVACGLNIYGVPWCPRLGRWAFYADDRRLRAHYEAVPENLDILISHSPPHGYGDLIPKGTKFNMGTHDIHVGTHQLTNILYDKKPRTVVCGHIHEGRGKYEYHSHGIQVYNVAYLTEEYEPWDLPACTHLTEFE